MVEEIMLATDADRLKAGDTFTADQGETWHQVKEVMSWETTDPNVDMLTITTTEGRRTWLWSNEEVVVRL